MPNQHTVAKIKTKCKDFKFYVLDRWQQYVNEPNDTDRDKCWHRLAERQACRDFLMCLKWQGLILDFSLVDKPEDEEVADPLAIVRKAPYEDRLKKAIDGVKTMAGQETNYGPKYSEELLELLDKFTN